MADTRRLLQALPEGDPAMTMPQPEADHRRHVLATVMLQMTEQMTPIFDTADGMRADLESRGWSPTAAEQAAAAWLAGTLGAIGANMGGPR
jgi:hypothetical protein